MIEWKKIRKIFQVAKAIYCNKCGKKLKPCGDSVDYYERLHIDMLWGYFSPWDTERHKFDICPDCYREWTHSFKIPIEVTHEI